MEKLDDCVEINIEVVYTSITCELISQYFRYDMSVGTCQQAEYVQSYNHFLQDLINPLQGLMDCMKHKQSLKG